MNGSIRLFAFCVSCCLSLTGSAAVCSSARMFVILRPETSSFWMTAMNSTVTLPVVFPKNSDSAELVVTGDTGGYRAVYTVERGADEAVDLSVTLPAPSGPQSENVYSLKLTFSDGTVRTAKLGAVQGAAVGASGTTRCLLPAGSLAWRRVRGRAVLPVPYGAGSITVNGETADTGLDGAQGWYALDGLKAGNEVSLVADGEDAVTLKVLTGGMFLHVK